MTQTEKQMEEHSSYSCKRTDDLELDAIHVHPVILEWYTTTSHLEKSFLSPHLKQLLEYFLFLEEGAVLSTVSALVIKSSSIR